MAVPVPSISCCVLNHHNLFYQIQNALAFNRDTCCHLALCLRLVPFHSCHRVKRSFCRAKHWMTMSREMFNLDQSARQVSEANNFGNLPIVSICICGALLFYFLTEIDLEFIMENLVVKTFFLTFSASSYFLNCQYSTVRIVRVRQNLVNCRRRRRIWKP